MVNFPEKLRFLMHERGINQKTLAEKMGVSQAAVSKWLAGSVPGSNIWIKLAEFFGVNPIDFLASEELGPALKASANLAIIEAGIKGQILREHVAELRRLATELENRIPRITDGWEDAQGSKYEVAEDSDLPKAPEKKSKIK